MTGRGTRRERGMALLALLAVVVLAASWLLVKQLNAETGGAAAARKVRNAEVLNRAKQALIGYVAAQAAKTLEDNPGALPCPEAAGYYGSPSQEGQTASSCTLPKVGRFPWRTIGTDKLVDASGEPLWYVVSPGWANTGSNTSINSNSTGQLTVDGVANSAVALIIAPGPAFSAPAATGCIAWNQTRPTSGTLDWRNYLECDNATYPTPDASFVTAASSAAFNDQVVVITAADILPAIEAAVADRIERDVAPTLRSMYNGGAWSGSSSIPLLPFPAAFATPSTSAMQGVTGTLQGLLPLSYAETAPASGVLCTPSGAAPRCSPSFVSWSSSNISDMAGGLPFTASCTTTAAQVSCSYFYWCWLGGCASSFTLNATASNVGMAMRQINSATTMTNVAVAGRSASAVLNANGSATVALSGTTTADSGGANASCGISGFWTIFFSCMQGSIAVPITLFADHPILDSTSTGAGLGWLTPVKASCHFQPMGCRNSFSASKAHGVSGCSATTRSK